MGTLESARQWIDWAYGTFASERWDDAQYNLGQFQGLYDSSRANPGAYGLTASDAAEMDKLNGRAALLRSMLAERQTWTTANSWWAPFLPDTARSSIASAGASAAAEATRSAQIAAAAGDTLTANQADILAGEAVSETQKEIAGAPNAYTDFMNISPLGIPLWAWGIGAFLGVLSILRRK